MSFIDKWKAGIMKITPLQQLESSQKGNWVMLAGFIAGIVVMAFKLQTWWWIELILCAGLFNHIIMMIGIHQKIQMFKGIENFGITNNLKGGI